MKANLAQRQNEFIWLGEGVDYSFIDVWKTGFDVELVAQETGITHVLFSLPLHHLHPISTLESRHVTRGHTNTILLKQSL